VPPDELYAVWLDYIEKQKELSKKSDNIPHIPVIR
jgi:hypothetical protein